MLKYLDNSYSIDDIKAVLNSITIFDKIEFSNISKETIRNKIKDLRENRVPNRTVFLDEDSESIVFYWFRNWLHPLLKHCVGSAPTDTRGCSAKVLGMDRERNMLHFHENGQQNFRYTLADIENYAKE